MIFDGDVIVGYTVPFSVRRWQDAGAFLNHDFWSSQAMQSGSGLNTCVCVQGFFLLLLSITNIVFDTLSLSLSLLYLICSLAFLTFDSVN